MEVNKNNKKDIFIVSLLILIIAVVYSFFPTIDLFQKISVLLVFLILLPVLFNIFIFKKGVEIYKLGIGDIRAGIIWSISLLVGALMILYIAFNYSPFLSNYKLPIEIVDNFYYFIIYELIFVLILSFIYQFFYGGFIISIYESSIGIYSTIVSAFVFWGMVLFSGSNFWISLPFLIFMPLAGIITQKSGSIWYSTITQFIFVIITDVFFIKTIF